MTVDELPEEEIRAAEEGQAPHGHGPLDEAGLLDHVRTIHGLDAPDLSTSTVAGLHDRLHDETDAVDDVRS